MDRTIEIKVAGNHLSKDNRYAGVQGEYNMTWLRISFDAGWDGFAKTITWWDALGEHPVRQDFTTDKLEDIAQSTRVYRMVIPGEPLRYAGDCTFVIDGWIDGKRQRSVETMLTVKPAEDATDPAEPADPTPSQAEQLQAQIEAIKETIQQASQSAADAGNSAEHANESERSAAASASEAESYAGSAEGSAAAALASESAAEKAPPSPRTLPHATA